MFYKVLASVRDPILQVEGDLCLICRRVGIGCVKGKKVITESVVQSGTDCQLYIELGDLILSLVGA